MPKAKKARKNGSRAKQEIARDERGYWLPGQSGNPAGRKPGPSFMDEVRKALEKGGTLATIIKAYLKAAEKGDLRAIMDLADRLDGKPLQRQELTGAEGGPLVVIDRDFEESRNGDG